jgi:class 3 adenylate cyclase
MMLYCSTRFARDCMQRARQLTKKLEVTLGPDTGDLTMRAGLHSGPVTAGVLRGERSRFQLFGGTFVHVAARLLYRSTGSVLNLTRLYLILLIIQIV